MTCRDLSGFDDETGSTTGVSFVSSFSGFVRAGSRAASANTPVVVWRGDMRGALVAAAALTLVSAVTVMLLDRGYSNERVIFVGFLALVFLVLGHLLIMNILDGGVQRINFAFVAGRWSSPFWQVWDLLQLWLAMLHGANGLRVIINDYADKDSTRFRLKMRESRPCRSWVAGTHVPLLTGTACLGAATGSWADRGATTARAHNVSMARRIRNPPLPPYP